MNNSEIAASLITRLEMEIAQNIMTAREQLDCAVRNECENRVAHLDHAAEVLSKAASMADLAEFMGNVSGNL